MHSRSFALLAAALIGLTAAGTGAEEESSANDRLVHDKYGAIVRGDVHVKRLSLVFTGDEFGESAEPILDELKARGAKAAFFLTGGFLRQQRWQPVVRRMIDEGHYVGPHSDGHLLYCDWENREKTLVTRAKFREDLKKNIAELRKAGALGDGRRVLFIPPYEWYNRDQVKWSRELDVVLVNFTPGSGSNRDYAREGDPRFVPSRQILADILAYEEKDPHGLNGFVLLLHLGSGRADPFHAMFGKLCDELKGRGYGFVRMDELIAERSE